MYLYSKIVAVVQAYSSEGLGMGLREGSVAIEDITFVINVHAMLPLPLLNNLTITLIINC